MEKIILKAAVVALAVAALPSAAQAGTATATSTASMTVINQCTVTGANILIGSFMTGKTWREIGTELGIRGTEGRQGTRGSEYATYGSVNCGSGVPYTLKIVGSHTSGQAPGGVEFKIGTQTAVFVPYVKKIGAVAIENTWGGGFYGAYVSTTGSPPVIGTGAAQAIVGSFALHSDAGALSNATTAAGFLDSKVTAAGSYSDDLTYTLTF